MSVSVDLTSTMSTLQLLPGAFSAAGRLVPAPPPAPAPAQGLTLVHFSAQRKRF